VTPFSWQGRLLPAPNLGRGGRRREHMAFARALMRPKRSGSLERRNGEASAVAAAADGADQPAGARGARPAAGASGAAGAGVAPPGGAGADAEAGGGGARGALTPARSEAEGGAGAPAVGAVGVGGGSGAPGAGGGAGPAPQAQARAELPRNGNQAPAPDVLLREVRCPRPLAAARRALRVPRSKTQGAWSPRQADTCGGCLTAVARVHVDGPDPNPMQVARLEAEKAALAKRSAEAAEREAMQAATLQAVNQRLAEDNAALAARVAGLERPAPGGQARARSRLFSAGAVGAARRCGGVPWPRGSSRMCGLLRDCQLPAGAGHPCAPAPRPCSAAVPASGVPARCQAAAPREQSRWRRARAARRRGAQSSAPAATAAAWSAWAARCGRRRRAAARTARRWAPRARPGRVACGARGAGAPEVWRARA
jgi:hypothetical protein